MMGEYAMSEALRTYGYGNPKVEIYVFDKVPCPVCGKMCGGKSGFPGEVGRTEGVHQHMRFVHGIKKKRRRESMLEASESLADEAHTTTPRV